MGGLSSILKKPAGKARKTPISFALARSTDVFFSNLTLLVVGSQLLFKLLAISMVLLSRLPSFVSKPSLLTALQQHSAPCCSIPATCSGSTAR
jgi:hypothetical protein